MRGVTPFLIPLSYARRDAPYIADKLQAYISTHTPHARRDMKELIILHQNIQISTHTPHARRDCTAMEYRTLANRCQLTRLMRGVTMDGETECQ